ncbi:tripartite tricarboxylate transporter permease [Falsiroseomonas sp. HW251]|uniref:tripartite tricarboxylate transporter permease n=1 Tax=Falsiroseomonas sp. HW251 TaxID=3390998 RepID=UPI003D314CCB
MMESLAGLAQGFGVAMTAANLLWCLVGVALGTAVGVLPGLGPTATISLLLPITYRLDATASLIMLSGIYYGAMYGGSITSILVKIPGEASSIVTCIDGHEMARRGRAGAALGISAFGSFIAGVVATFGVALAGPPLAGLALAFGPAEYTALVLFGLVLVTQIGEGSRLRALLMAALGLLASAIGLDPISGMPRFTFGIVELQDGLDIAVLAMGLFGVAEVLALAAARDDKAQMIDSPRGLRALLPDRADWRASAAPIGRGSVLGFVLGLLPGGGALISSFASYVMERRLAKDPSRFGQGAIEGVAGPESANNAAAQASFVPLLSLGIPSNVVMGVMIGALMIQGIAPGPMLAAQRPDLFWGVIASMLVGNVMLLVLNIPLLPVFVALLRVPQRILAPLILLFCVVGAYSLQNSAFDVVMVGIFGVLGFLLRLVKLDPAPFMLAFVLGELLEKSLRQALLIGIGSPMILVQKPISATLLVMAALVLLWPALRWVTTRTGRTRP